jgi:hypothetical protein
VAIVMPMMSIPPMMRAHMSVVSRMFRKPLIRVVGTIRLIVVVALITQTTPILAAVLSPVTMRHSNNFVWDALIKQPSTRCRIKFRCEDFSAVSLLRIIIINRRNTAAVPSDGPTMMLESGRCGITVARMSLATSKNQQKHKS